MKPIFAQRNAFHSQQVVFNRVFKEVKHQVKHPVRYLVFELVEHRIDHQVRRQDGEIQATVRELL